jgi:hypothetical protein
MMRNNQINIKIWPIEFHILIKFRMNDSVISNTESFRLSQELSIKRLDIMIKNRRKK